MKISLKFYAFKIFYVLSFNFKKQFWFFGTNFPKKVYIQSKTGKWTSSLVLHIRSSLCIKCRLNWQFWGVFLDKISPNRVVLVEGRKSKLHYSVLQIQISLTSVSQYFDEIFWSKFSFHHKWNEDDYYL